MGLSDEEDDTGSTSGLLDDSPPDCSEGPDYEFLQLIKLVPPNDEENVHPATIQLVPQTMDLVFKTIGDLPISVICVCGTSAQDNRLLLSYMIRCLEGMEKGGEADWMGWKDKTRPLKGFACLGVGTSNGPSQGILAWSRPFLIRSKGREMAVVLMDAQVSPEGLPKITGLGLLTSSVMVINSSHAQMDANLPALNNLIQNIFCLDSGDSSTIPFQKLSFLIREWNNPCLFPFGGGGGRLYLEDKLKVTEDHSPEAKQVRGTIQKCFQELDCFLISEIGEKVHKTDFKGSLDQLLPKFAVDLETFISSILLQSQLPTKEFMGTSLSASALKSCLDTYVEIFNTEEEFSPESFWKAPAQFYNNRLIETASRLYRQTMDSIPVGGCSYLQNDQLDKDHDTAHDIALDMFKNDKKYGSQETILELDQKLEQLIENAFSQIKQENEDKRQAFVTDATIEASNEFRAEMERQFSLDDPKSTEFYDEAKIITSSKVIKEALLEQFQTGFPNEPQDRLTALVRSTEGILDSILESIIKQNQANREGAESEAATTSNELVINHRSQLTDFLNAENCDSDNPTALQIAHESIKLAMIKKFQQIIKPGKEDFYQEYITKMENEMELTLANLKNEHELYTQKFLQCMDRSILAHCHQYEKELRVLDHCQILEDPGLHSRKTSKIIADFRQELTLFARVRSRTTELERRLLEGLEQVWDTVHTELSEKRKMDSYKKASDHALNYYLERIRNFLQSNAFIPDENLGAEHERIRSEAIEEYDAFDKVGEPDPEQDQSIKSKLLHEIEEEYSQVRDENKAKIDLAISKAHECLYWSMSVYSKDIKDEMDGLANLENLQQCHERSRANSLAKFKETFPIIDIILFQQFETELKSKMEATFEKLKKEEMITIRELLVDARKLYHEEMGKRSKNNLFQWPAHLEDIHEGVKAAVLLKFERKSTLTQLGRLSLDKDMDELYGIYDMKNDMKLNSGDMGAAPALGIDLGTTYCCVAVFYKGKVHIIPNVAQGGIETTPSYVAFNPDGTETFGKTAKDDSYKNPDYTIYDAKRIIGRKMDDPNLQKDMRYWPFTVKEDEGVPKVMVNWKPLHPERISGKMLAHCKRMGEEFLKMKPGTIRKAVITVPAYFNDGQRQATVDAGKLAQLEVLTILNEPTAAAIAYSLEGLDTDPRKILVYDLGGGTFDVAVLDVKPKHIEVLGVKGDTHLGGENFDRRLMEYCVKKFKQASGIDLLDGKDSEVKQERDDARRRLRRLEIKCEKAKKKLSSAETITVNVDAIKDGINLAVTVKRSKFEELNMADFQKTLQLVEETLFEVKLGKDDIDDVVLVGGSSRIPKVQQLLEQFFVGKTLNKSIHPDLAVAYGAAVQAALMNGEQAKGQLEFSQIQDVTPMPLGIEIVTGELSVILPRNTKIPTRKMDDFFTVRDNQTSVDILVYQGEDLKLAKSNKLLGKFRLTGIPPKGRGEEPIDVWMEINSMGILHVEAVCRSNEKKESITVHENKLRMSDATIKEILNEEADSGRETDQDRDQEHDPDGSSEGDITSLILQSSLEELEELAKKVEDFTGPHFTSQYRSLLEELGNLRSDLEGLDATGREALQTKKGRALRRIDMLVKEIKGKVHGNGKTCKYCKVSEEE